MLAALAVLVVPASALATPYLTLKEAGLAAKVAVGHRYHEAGRGSVEYFIRPNTDCRRNSHISVDCGYECSSTSTPAAGRGYVRERCGCE